MPRITNSMDAIAGPITNMLDFSQKVNPGHRHQVFLNASDGTIAGGHK
jgi:hypothetical protein